MKFIILSFIILCKCDELSDYYMSNDIHNQFESDEYYFSQEEDQMKKAIIENNIEFVKHLMDIGYPPPNGALKYAIKHSTIDMYFLIRSMTYECGGISNLEDKDRDTTEQQTTTINCDLLSVKYGRLDIIKHGGYVRNEIYQSMILLSIKYGHIKILKYLFLFSNVGIYFDAKHKMNQYINFAKDNNQHEILKYLKQI